MARDDTIAAGIDISAPSRFRSAYTMSAMVGVVGEPHRSFDKMQKTRKYLNK
jgi:hypothetical protein